jgi:hypothetical protein
MTVKDIITMADNKGYDITLIEDTGYWYERDSVGNAWRDECGFSLYPNDKSYEHLNVVSYTVDDEDRVITVHTD